MQHLSFYKFAEKVFSGKIISAALVYRALRS